MRCALTLCLLIFALTGCASSKPKPPTPLTSPAVQATSLLGKPLLVQPVPADQRERLESDVVKAQVAFNQDPSEENAIWFGRRLAYVGYYNEAISTFTIALDRYPNSARLLRHRGHRFITVRRLDDAIRDLQLAAEKIQGTADQVEPDGIPNARNLPRSTLNSNIWYHLGLAHYLKGSYEQAAAAFATCMDFSRTNDDQLVATSYWLYLSRMRTGDRSGAATILQGIRRDMDVIENQPYQRLLLCFKGELKPSEVAEGADALSNPTIAYGLAMRKVLRGEGVAAKADFQRIITSPNWSAFGYIAAEAELARRR